MVVHLCVEPDGRGDQTGRTVCTGRRAQGKHDDAETGECSGDELHRSYRVKREFLGSFVLFVRVRGEMAQSSEVSW